MSGHMPLPNDAGRDTDSQHSGSGLRWVTVLLVILVVGVLFYNYHRLKQKDPWFKLGSILKRIPEGDSLTLGKRVTFFAISPLTTVVDWNHDNIADGLRTTAYTKIGFKNVPAAGSLDFALYEYDSVRDAKGKRIETWQTIVLPDSQYVAWGSWPLGGWEVKLQWKQQPNVKIAYLEAKYTKPDGRTLVNGQPVRLSSARASLVQRASGK